MNGNGDRSEGDRLAAVTGATGFIGTHLCRRLLDDGWRVRGLRRPGSEPRLGILDDESDDRLEWVVGDGTLSELVDGAEGVFHLAGVGLWDADPDAVDRVNVDGTEAVLEACREAGVDRLAFTSTAGTRRPGSGERGNGTTATAAAFADETDVATPIGAYQASKARAEVHVDRYAADPETGAAVTVHPTSVFGPGDERFTARLLEFATEPTRIACPPGGASIVGVDDVVDGIRAAYERGDSGAHYLLGGENLTYLEATTRIARRIDGHPPRIRVPPAAVRAAGPVAEVVGRVTDRRVFPFDADMAQLATRRLFYTSRVAHEELGYTYGPLEAHLPEAVAWYRDESGR